MVGLQPSSFINALPARPLGHFYVLLALALFTMPVVAADSVAASMPPLASNDVMAIHVRVDRDSNQYFRGMQPADKIQPVVTISWQATSSTPSTAVLSISATNISTNAKYGIVAGSGGTFVWGKGVVPGGFNVTLPSPPPSPPVIVFNSTSSPAVPTLAADSLPPGTYMLTAIITAINDSSGNQIYDPVISDNTSTVFVTVSNSSRQFVPEINPLLIFCVLAGVLIVSRASSKNSF